MKEFLIMLATIIAFVGSIIIVLMGAALTIGLAFTHSIPSGVFATVFILAVSIGVFIKS